MRSEVAENLRQRLPIEDRWLADLSQYHGRPGVIPSAKDVVEGQGPINPAAPVTGFNRTRIKTNVAAGRLADILFPGDDKNWSIEPSPAPELLARMKDEKIAIVAGQEWEDSEGRPLTGADLANREMAAAREASEAMSKEIDDQHNACRAGAEARMSIFDAAQLGTGILKGPVVEGVQRKAWTRDANGGRTLVMLMDRKPAVRRISPWNFVPDMSACTMEQADFVYERIYTTRNRLKNLAVKSGFNAAGLKAVMDMVPGTTNIVASSAMDQMRALSGLNPARKDNRYEIWLYNGWIPTEHLLAIGAPLPEEKDDRLLPSYPAVAWFCAGKLIKAAVSPLDTGDLPFGVFPWEHDEASIFGFGVPYLGRNSANTIDRAWDAMLVSAEKSAGPQIVMRLKHIEAANGKNDEIGAYKLWHATDKVGEVKDAFQTFDFPNHQEQFAAIIRIASGALDEETMIPDLAHGEQGTASPTLGGMAMLINASLTPVRKQVKQWDDCMTVPLITRFYDWNMLNSDKEEIKGDFEVKATGTSGLLVREIVGQELIQIANLAATNPNLEPWTKMDVLYRKLISTTHISPDEIVRTKAEYDAEMKSRAESQGPNEAQMKADLEQAKIDVKKMEVQAVVFKAESEERIANAKLYAERLISQEEFAAREREIDKRLNVDVWKFQQELGFKVETGRPGL